MLNALDSLIISTKFRVANFIEDFRKEERGVAPFVATILLIVIVVSLCAMFWTNISSWFTTMWAKITGDAGAIGAGGGGGS